MLKDMKIDKEYFDNLYLKEKHCGDGSQLRDNFHSMSELYFHRMCLFIALCKAHKDKAWKSKLHDDGTMFEDYFIVGINTPEGQYTYHYDIKFFDMFNCKELSHAPKYDGHTPKDIYRLFLL